MNTRDEPTLTLEAVAKHFARWRRNKNNGERIPEALWNEALDLLGTYGISQVSRTLRLSYTELGKRRELVDTRQYGQATDDAAFVEVDQTLVDQVPRSGEATAVWMELERPDGLRLRIRPTHSVDMLALVERFMGA
jgi:hypothetical protein